MDSFFVTDKGSNIISEPTEKSKCDDIDQHVSSNHSKKAQIQKLMQMYEAGLLEPKTDSSTYRNVASKILEDDLGC